MTLPVPAGRSGGARALAVTAVAALMLSCGDSGTEPPPQPPAPVATSLTVTPASAEFAALGETVQLAAEVRDQNGQAMAGAPVTARSGEAAGAVEIAVEQAVAEVEVSPSGATAVAGRVVGWGVG